MEIWDILDENRKLTGKTHVRGEMLKPGEFHLVVNVWIKNSRNEYLISKRSPQKPSANLWEATVAQLCKGMIV